MSKPGLKPGKWRSLQIAQRMRAAGREQLKEFIALSQNQAVDSTVMLTMASDNYYASLMNWLHSMTSVGVTNIVVLAMDEALHNKLLGIGVASFYSKAFLEHVDVVFTQEQQRIKVKTKEKMKTNAKFRRSALKQVALGRLWCMRMLVIRSLLEAGLHVVQSDADAVPFQNPFPLLKRAPGDIVAQRGVFPMRVSKDWTGVGGYVGEHAKYAHHHGTLCFGFIMYRSTPATLALIDLSWTLVTFMLDDQKGVQYAICGCFVFTWTHDGPGGAVARPYQDLDLDLDASSRSVIETATSTGTIVGNRPLKVSFLPQQLVPRHCGAEYGKPESQPDVVITHCYAKKEAKLKIKRANEFGVAFLGEHWKNMTRFEGETAVGYLQRLGSHPKASFPCESLRKSVEQGNREESDWILDHAAASLSSGFSWNATGAAAEAAAVLRERCP